MSLLRYYAITASVCAIYAYLRKSRKSAENVKECYSAPLHSTRISALNLLRYYAITASVR